MKRALLAPMITAMLGAAALQPALAVGPTGEWAFRALLDGEPIGEHRFSVTGEGDERRVLSRAEFAVKFLGITAYRYRHEATERWRGNCLTALDSTTDNDGKPESVRADQRDALKGCVMSFAYWNPAIQRQARLLNAQTGRSENVQVRASGGGMLDVRGRRVSGTRWRIEGPAQPIDVWYSAEGEWLGLDSTVDGGRKLSYRLK